MATYPYPADEFDEAPAGGRPVGVHRRRRSRWSRAWPFLAVVLLFAAVGAGLVLINSVSEDDPAGPTAGPAGETTPDVSEEPSEDADASEQPGDPADPSGEPTGTPTASDPATSTPTPSATTSATPPAADPSGPIDRDLAIRVLNATSRAGVAAEGAERLSAAGWTSVTAANYSGGTLAESVVMYREAADEATARRVAEDLGIATVTLVPQLRGPVSAVLVSPLD